MKTASFRPLIAATCLALFAASLGSQAARAQTIVPLGTTSIPDGGTAVGGDIVDYKFLGSDPNVNNPYGGQGGQPASLNYFSQTQFSDLQYGGNGLYSNLQTPDGSQTFLTGAGIQYIQFGGSNPSTFDLASFRLNAGTNLSLSLYVLYGNTDGNGIFDQDLGLSLNGGLRVAASIVDTTQTNNFYRFDVTGLNAGDTLTISATTAALDANGNGNSGAYIGGAVFVIPEPSTWALVVLGAGSCGLMQRCRRCTTPR